MEIVSELLDQSMTNQLLANLRFVSGYGFSHIARASR
jgi:hypothetical protein